MSNFSEGEFLVCFKEDVNSSVANYLIGGLKLELGNEGKPIEIYSNVYSVICPKKQEGKYIKLVIEELINHIHWADRRCTLFEKRVKLVNEIQLGLDNIPDKSDLYEKQIEVLSKINNLVRQLN